MQQKTPIEQLKPPPGLTPAQKREAARLLPGLRHAGVRSCDQGALAQYLHHWQVVQECKAHLAEHGVTIITPNGSVQVSPFHTMLRQNSELLLRWARELGATPQARKRLGVEFQEEETDDDLL